MKKHASKFDSHPQKLARNEAVGLPKYAGVKGQATGKVREGLRQSGKKELSAKACEQIDTRWKSVMETLTGYATYTDMRSGINEELGRNFCS